MIQFAVAYVGTALAMLVLDIIWLTQMVNRLYQPRIGELLAEKPSMPPAVVFYLLYVAGIVILAVMPALREGGWKRLLVHAPVFGLVAYATYDLTNQATMKTWSTTITLVDMAWGTFITTVAASAGYAAARWFGAGSAISDPAHMPVAWAVAAVVGIFLVPLMNSISRYDENAADRFSLKVAHEPDGLAKALVKTIEYRASSPSRLEEILFYDHPSVERRIHAAMVWKATRQKRSTSFLSSIFQPSLGAATACKGGRAMGA